MKTKTICAEDAGCDASRLHARCGRKILYGVMLYGATMLFAPAEAVAQYTTVYNFAYLISYDGAGPFAGLTYDGSMLYGTTQSGPTVDGEGTLFSFDPNSHVETVLHGFAGSYFDGSGPQAPVTVVGNTIYGTTLLGGSPGAGTVFAYSQTTGTSSIAHNFFGNPPYGDGSEPMAAMTLVGSTLYGTTRNGGINNYGTLFSYNTTTGVEKVLANFGNAGNGSEPVAGVTLVGSTLYGTTQGGGANGAGTIFSYDINTGIENILYSFTGSQFGGSNDGRNPASVLTLHGSTLYGTTQYGGTSALGTLFSFDINTHAETMLYSFGGTANSDGAQPMAGVTLVDNKLYGTTQYGGTNGTQNAGTVYAFDLGTSQETIIHSFTFGSNSVDGYGSTSDLTLVGNTLYGTTPFGGTLLGGTIFTVKVPEPGSIVLACMAALGVVLRLGALRINRKTIPSE